MAKKRNAAPGTDEAVGGKQLPASAEVISNKPLNLRAGPHVSYEVLCQLPPGTTVELLSLPDGISVKGWMPVRFVSGETTVSGWVMAHYMQVIEDGQ